MKSKSGTPAPVPQAESPLRHLPLVDLLVDTKTELLELALRSGLRVFTEMLEEDRTALCGPRYAHEPDRPARRTGSVRSEVVLGGRKVAIRRPRARTADGEAPLPTFQTMAKTDPLDDLALAVLLLDGVHVGEHCLIVALGISEDGTKHALGLWDGSTETAASVRDSWRTVSVRRTAS